MLLTPEQAAAVLQVTPDTVRDWARKGIIPARRKGRLWRFDEQEITAGKTEQPCPSIVIRNRPIGGFDSPSMAEKFASQRGQRTVRRQKNTSTSFATVTGVRLSLVKSAADGRKPPSDGSGNDQGSAA